MPKGRPESELQSSSNATWKLISLITAFQHLKFEAFHRQSCDPQLSTLKDLVRQSDVKSVTFLFQLLHVCVIHHSAVQEVSI